MLWKWKGRRKTAKKGKQLGSLVHLEGKGSGAEDKRIVNTYNADDRNVLEPLYLNQKKKKKKA